jgi:hypothetical protein
MCRIHVRSVAKRDAQYSKSRNFLNCRVFLVQLSFYGFLDQSLKSRYTTRRDGPKIDSRGDIMNSLLRRHLETVYNETHFSCTAISFDSTFKLCPLLYTTPSGLSICSFPALNLTCGTPVTTIMHRAVINIMLYLQRSGDGEDC